MNEKVMRGSLRRAELNEIVSHELLHALRRRELVDIGRFANVLLDLVNDPATPSDSGRDLCLRMYQAADHDPEFEALFIAAVKRSPRQPIAEFGLALERRAELRSTPLDLELKTFDGKAANLADFRGKVVLLDFWSNWCSSCIEAMPEIERVYQSYREFGFEVLGVWTNQAESASVSERDTALRHIRKQQVTYPNLVLEGPDKEALVRKFAITGYPLMWLFGRDGRLIATDVGGPRLHDAVRLAVRAPVKTGQ